MMNWYFRELAVGKKEGDSEMLLDSDFTFQLLSASVTVSPHKWRPPKKLWWFRSVKSIQ